MLTDYDKASPVLDNELNECADLLLGSDKQINVFELLSLTYVRRFAIASFIALPHLLVEKDLLRIFQLANILHYSFSGGGIKLEGQAQRVCNRFR